MHGVSPGLTTSYRGRFFALKVTKSTRQPTADLLYQQAQTTLPRKNNIKIKDKLNSLATKPTLTGIH